MSPPQSRHKSPSTFGGGIHRLVVGLLGAALLFGVATGVRAQERAQETALLPPAILDESRLEAAQPLPRILTQRDVELYRKIFAEQSEGHWKTADTLIARVQNKILLGHVKAQRYLHPTAYRSSWVELRDWLQDYADLADAKRIYGLAVRRKPASAKAPRAPERGYLGGNGADAVRDVHFYVSPRKRSGSEQASIRNLAREIRSLIGKGSPSAALRKLDTKAVRRLLDPVEFAEQRGQIAKGMFVFGKDAEALRLAAKSAEEAGDDVPAAYWIAGMAAWRLGKVEEAEKHFSALAMSENAARTQRSAGAYWAARAALQLRKPADSTRWLARAAQYPLTFYGLLGRRALGVEVPFDWSLPEITDRKAKRLLSHEGARRAIALMQVGESSRAEREWRKLFPRLDRSLREPLMTIATRHNMPGLAIRLAGIIRVSTGRIYHAALYPVPRWAPADGFSVDRALIYGIIRQESGFDPRARSGRGARGLMQLMPRTANYMDANDDLEERHELYDPALNLQLGQRYVDHLLHLDRVDGDLFRLLVAYNAGPGNLGRWARSVNFKDDPLLFIESIPSRETREFIERVLSNVWIYRHRLGQTAPSLDRVAAGDWAIYRGIDDETGFKIRNARFGQD
ncbi:lytic transglycosylase domain-containing protein [Thalassobaculum salexigens]|uniref:lytic transglycosylase domain-containing protein n=1 Tax=Thalassobaculum salexigens TaxID=455360 RepID=UPI00248F1D36|nr:lytic transglycosylase domain-containing protein [Thalassobaculum salexigens]